MRSSKTGAPHLLLVACFIAVSACSTSRVIGKAPTTDGEAEIVQIAYKFSNGYLIKSKRPVLIESGAEFDLDRLRQGLKENGVRPEDLALVILTHGHSDHAGLGGTLQKSYHLKIAAGAGDAKMLADGHNDDLKPQYFTARIYKPFIDAWFDPYRPDLLIEHELDLRPYGIRGKAVVMPGHTPGSLVVLLDDHRAFVGDILLGGSLGGAISPTSPGVHYYQADPAANFENLRKLVREGVQVFYLGHGGPVQVADVKRAFELP